MKIYLIVCITLFISLGGCKENRTEISNDPYERGVSFAVQGKFKKAENAFKDALNDAEDKSAAQESRDIVQKVLSDRLDTQAAVHFFRGIQHGNRGELELAYSYLSKAVKIVPEFAIAYYERGLVNARLKLFDKAISDFTRSIDINPNDAPAYNNRGLAYARGKKDYQKGIADFTRAVKIDADFAEAYDNRGIAYQMASDNKEKSCADWKKACELNRCRSFEIAKGNGYCS